MWRKRERRGEIERKWGRQIWRKRERRGEIERKWGRQMWRKRERRGERERKIYNGDTKVYSATNNTP